MAESKPSWADGALKQGFSLIEMGRKGRDNTDEWILTRPLDLPVARDTSDALDSILFNPHAYLATELSAIYGDAQQPLPTSLDVQIAYQENLKQPWILVMHADALHLPHEPTPPARVSLQVLLPWGISEKLATSYWTLPDPHVPETTFFHVAELQFPLGGGAAATCYQAHLHFGNDLVALVPATVRWMILQPHTFFPALSLGRLWEIIQVEKYVTPFQGSPQLENGLQVQVDPSLEIRIHVGRPHHVAEMIDLPVMGQPLSLMDGVSGCANMPLRTVVPIAKGYRITQVALTTWYPMPV